jgi:hypothetical protein
MHLCESLRMATKTKTDVGLSVRIPAPVKRGLEGWAQDENRSVSNLVEILLTKALAARQPNGQGV